MADKSFCELITSAKTFSGVTKVIQEQLKKDPNSIKVYQVVFNKLAVLLHGDNLITIRTDLLNSASNDITYTVRSDNGKNYDLIRDFRNKNRIKNNGLQEFYIYLQKELAS